MDKHYGLPRATVDCYRLIMGLGKSHEYCMAQLKMHYESNKRVAKRNAMCAPYGGNSRG